MIKRLLIIISTVLLVSIVHAGTFDFSLQWDDNSSNFVDMSYLNHTPAGVSGPVTSLNGHTYINSGTERIKFLATNVTSSSCFPDKTMAPIIAKRMAKFGINLVRFHLADTWHWGESLFLNASATNTRTIDWTANGTGDRMEYFMKCLIDEGIYINMNLLAGRKFKSTDGLPASIDGMDWKDVQTPAMYYPGMLDLQKEYATNVLSHVNPYTSLAMKDNPAVAFVEVCNEHGLIHAWMNGQMDPSRLPSEFALDLQTRWDTFLTSKYTTFANLQSTWGISEVLGTEKLTNPDFSAGTTGWIIEEHAPAVITSGVVVDGHSPGINSLDITVNTISATDWHVQLNQNTTTDSSHPYTISFSAKASAPTTVNMILQENGGAWQTFYETDINLTASWQRFEFTIVPSGTTPTARLNFRYMSDEALTYSYADMSFRQGGTISGLKPGEVDFNTINIFYKADQGERPAKAKRDWVEFLWDLESTYWTEMNNHLKSALSIQGLTIGTVVGNSTPNLMNIFDVIDSHAYFNHPTMPADWSYWYNTNEPMADEVDGGTISGLSLKKVAGKPFTVTEYNHPAPMTYDSEAYIFMSAYGALQDWDALYTYTYDDGSLSWSGSYQNGFFEIDRHPGKIMSLIHAACMYRRGDVDAAADVVTVSMNNTDELDLLPTAGEWRLIDAEYSGMAKETGLIYRTEIVPEGGINPSGALSPGSIVIPSDDNFVSQTGQINWNASGASKYVTIDSPGTKSVLGSVTGQIFNLSGVIFRPAANMQNWASINMSVLDGESLTRNANKILLSAYGAIGNSAYPYERYSDGAPLSFPPARGEVFTGPTNFASTGTVIVEGVPCEIVLPYAWDYVKVYSLDEKGDRVTSLPVGNESGNAVFTINDTYNTLWYEIEIFTGIPPSTDTPTETPTSTETPGGPTHTPTETPTFTATVAAVLIDNLEDNDATNELGGYWFTYADPLSTMVPDQASYTSLAGGAGGSNYCAAIQGYVAPVVTATPASSPVYSYSGMGTGFVSDAGLPNCNKVDISGYTGIKFDAYGDGNDYMVAITYSDGSCNSLTGDDHHRFVFSPAAAWSEYKVPFTSLTQQSWGITVALIDMLQSASEIQFQVVGTDTTFDLRVDNLMFYNEEPVISPTETSTSTPSETETLIPTNTYTYTPTDTETFTYTPTQTYTITNTPTQTYTSTPSETPSPTQSPTKSPSKNIDKAHAYPTVYRANCGLDGVVFTNLTSETKLQIFNIKGEIVYSFSGSTLNGEHLWKLKGLRKLKQLASGLYIYVLTDGDTVKTGKVHIIR